MPLDDKAEALSVGKSTDNHYLADPFFVRGVKAILKAYGLARPERIEEKIATAETARYKSETLRKKARAIRVDAKEYEQKAQNEAQMLEAEAVWLEKGHGEFPAQGLDPRRSGQNGESSTDEMAYRLNLR